MADENIVDLGIEDITKARAIGAGGFGTVYRAHQASLRRDVAVKMVTSTVKDQKVRIRFEREIQAMGMLSGHPNIVTVYDSGFTASGQPYILMDLMEAGSLAEQLAREGTMTYAEVLNLMVKVCGALETAHQAGILHRDIKPENVLVSAYGEPKLGDFGIARLKGGPETGTASLTASIEHVSPELLESQPPSAASDIYALGSTMFKMLAGTAAFIHPEDESIVPALTRIRDVPVPDLRQKGVPDPVADIVERAMAKDPAQRYATAADMGNALRAAQRVLGLPQTALPVRAEDARAARDATRTLNSGDVANSIEEIRAGRVTGEGVVQPADPGAAAAGATGEAVAQGLSGPSTATGQTGPPPPPPPDTSQGYAPQQQAGQQGYSTQQGYTPQQGYPQQQAYPQQGYYQQPPAKKSPLVPILGGVGALVVVGVIVAVVLSSSGDDDPPPTPSPSATASDTVATATETASADPTMPPTPTPRETGPTPTPTAPGGEAPYADFVPIQDDSATITVSVPTEWTDRSGAPWEINGEAVGQQIEASTDLQLYRTTWRVPGLTFGVSEQLAQNLDAASLADAFDFSNQCTLVGRTDYSDPAYRGVRDDYENCGGGDAKFTVIAAAPGDNSYLLLVQFQSVSPRDEAALQRVIDTFFRPEAAGSTPAPAPTQ